MHKIAIISDIHGNSPALNAVLADIRSFKATAIYCLGDLTDAAPWHNEVIDLIRELEIPVVMGNHDERIAFDLPVIALKKHSIEEKEARLAAINYTKSTITSSNKAFLTTLSKSIRLEFPGLALSLVHGSPASNDEYIYESHDENLLREMLDNEKADVLISGHTHLSFIRYLSVKGNEKDKLVINAGSVGRTKEKDGKACYLQLNITDSSAASGSAVIAAVIRKVEYDINKTVEGIRKSEIPDFYAEFLKRE